MKENRILSIERPDLLKEWDYEKNALVCSPNEVTIGSGKKVWWKCDNGHSYQQSPYKRILRGYNCPYCSGKKIISGFNDFKTLKPELVKEWDYEKNIGLDPSNISLHSNKKVWWKCSVCGNEWQATINDRANSRSCPKCAIQKRSQAYIKTMLKKNKNSLAAIRKDLLNEWNYEKNDSISPYDLSINSFEKVWWKCSVCGNEWQASVGNRAVRESGCPKCMKHQRTSFPEQAILYYVKKLYPKTENSYTEIFAPSLRELDIYIPEIKFGIEYDGTVWHKDKRSTKVGKEKYLVCLKNNIKLIRVSEDENNNKEYCDYYIHRNGFTNHDLDEAIKKTISIFSDKKIDINCDRDRNKIMKQYITVIRKRSIAIKFPEQAKEWDYDKNDGITPEMVSAMSSVKYWWKCDKGHSYSATPANKLSLGTGCPYCSNQKVLPGFNDLKTRYPQVIKDWDFEKNSILPSEVMPGSQKKFWWKCPKGHSYSTTPNAKTSVDASCPYCSGRAVLKGYNDLATTNKDILKIWDYEKNTIKPDEISAGSSMQVWWKCDKGHSWKKRVVSQCNHNYCPVCKGSALEPGINDLKTLYPELVKEWDYKKNIIKPDEITHVYDKKVWWICKDCGYSWETKIYNRIKGTGCPECGYSKKMQKTIEKNVILNKRDLLTKFPEIAKEWDYEKNGDLDPSRISFGSNKKVWWKCPKGHSYQAWITDRTGKHKTGCPICSGRRKNNL